MMGGEERSGGESHQMKRRYVGMSEEERVALTQQTRTKLVALRVITFSGLRM